MKEKLLEIAKDKNVWGYIAAIAVCIILSLAFFYPDAVEGNELGQYDIRQGMAVGHETSEFLKNTGEKSWWTNSLFSGMPTFQISPTYPSYGLYKWINTFMRAGLPGASGYLFSMMFGFLIMGMAMRMRWYYALMGAIAWGFSSYFIILIGAGHLWKFFTLTYVPPTIGGLLLAYRGSRLTGCALTALFAMMQLSSNHFQMTYYFAFLMLGIAIAYLVQALREKRVKQWLVSTGTVIVAGILAVMANSPSLYNTYQYNKETIRGKHSLLTDNANRDANPVDGLDKDYITQYSYGKAESFSLLIPNIKGGASAKPVNGQIQALNLASLEKASKMEKEGKIDALGTQYLSYVSQYFGEPESTNGPVYVGAIICVFFLLGCCIVKGPLKWSLLSLTVLSVLLALGRNCMWLTDFFIDYIPLYKNFRTPESILVVAEFTMPLLGVLGMIEFFKTEHPFKKYRKPLIFAFGLPAFFCLLGMLWPGIYGTAVTESDMQISEMISHQLRSQGYDAQVAAQFSLENPAIYHAVTTLRHSMVESDSWRSFIFILVAFIAVWAFSRNLLPRWTALVAIGVLVAGDLYTADKRYLSHESFCSPEISSVDYFPLSANDKAILQDTAMNYRVLDIPSFWRPDPSYHHKAVGGYHAAKLTRYQDIIDRHLSPVTQMKGSEADMRVVNMLNAKYIIMPNGNLIKNSEAYGNAWFVDNVEWVDNPNDEMAMLDRIDPLTTAIIDEEFKGEIKAPSQIPVAGDTIYEVKYAPNRLTYHASVSAPSLAVFSEVYYPGWRARIDGEEVPVVRADYILRALNVPEGTHSVEMFFEPASVTTTETLAYISIILIYLLCLVSGVFALAPCNVAIKKT